MLFVHLVALAVVSASKAAVFSFIFYLLSYRMVTGGRGKIKLVRWVWLFVGLLIFFVAAGAMRVEG